MDFLVDHLPFKAKISLRRCITFICIFLFAYLSCLAYTFSMAATKTTAFFRLSYRFIDISAVFGFASITIYSVLYLVESFLNCEKYAARYAPVYEDELEEGGGAE